MSNDLTQNLSGSLEDKVDRLIVVVQSMDSRLESIEIKLDQVPPRDAANLGGDAGPVSRVPARSRRQGR